MLLAETEDCCSDQFSSRRRVTLSKLPHDLDGQHADRGSVKDDPKGCSHSAKMVNFGRGRCQNSLATGVAAGPKPERAVSHPMYR